MEASWPLPSETSLFDRGGLTSTLRKDTCLTGKAHLVLSLKKPYLMASAFGDPLHFLIRGEPRSHRQ